MHKLLQCGDLADSQCESHRLIRYLVPVYHTAASFQYVPFQRNMLDLGELFFGKVVEDCVPVTEFIYLVDGFSSVAELQVVQRIVHLD